jgi:phage terminase small subunit
MGRRAQVDEDVVDPLAGLTLKERKFVEAYLGEAAGNATRAARLAGYSGDPVTLAAVGYARLRKTQIRDAIAQLVDQDELVPSRIERLRLLAATARGEATDQRLTADGDIVEIRVPRRDQVAAIKVLCELAGDFREPDKADDGLPPDLSLEQLFDLAGIPRGEPEQPAEPH